MVDEIYRTEIFSACDGIYFEKYAFTLLASLDQNSPGQSITILVMNPSGNFDQLSKEYLTIFKSIKINLIIENIDLQGINPKNHGTIYSVYRFIFIEKYISRFPREFLFLDIDSCIRKDLLLLFNYYQECDVAIHTRPYKKLNNRKLMAGVIYFNGVQNGCRQFLREISKRLKVNFKSLSWYADQLALYDAYKKVRNKINIAHLDKKYIDWEFTQDSIIWTAKGDRKEYQNEYLDYTNILKKRYSEEGTEICILVPRIDLGFKKDTSYSHKSILKRRNDPVRIYWHYFGKILREAYQSRGIKCDLLVAPNWEFNEAFVKQLAYKSILVPHSTSAEIADKRCLFYMQDIYHFLFTIDKSGWGASSSKYNSKEWIKNDIISESTKVFMNDIKKNKITKYAQNNIEIPEFEIFFPLQIPTDQTLKLHSKYTFEEIFKHIVSWAQKEKIRLFIKYHPFDKEPLFITKEDLACSNIIFCKEGNVHDLIERAKVVFVANSGVGFEALLHNKPVINFADAFYDTVTHKYDIASNNLSNLYTKVLTQNEDVRFKSYQSFIQWYLNEYSYNILDEKIIFKIENSLLVEIDNPYLNDIKTLVSNDKAVTLASNWDSDIQKPADILPKQTKTIFRRFYEYSKTKYFEYIHKKITFSNFTNKTVAVIGNGNSLHNKGLGYEIDSHDVVIRFNLGYPYTLKKDFCNAPLLNMDGFQYFEDTRVSPLEKHYIIDTHDDKAAEYSYIKDRGCRTDIWCCATADKSRQKFYQKLFSKSIILWPSASFSYKSIVINIFKYKFRILHKNIYEYFKVYHNIEPSSGLIIFEYLRKNKSIKKISLYGFDFFESGHILRSNQLILMKNGKWPHSPSFEKEYILNKIKKDPRICIEGFKKN